ncbi:ATP-binding protein [Nonomuraea muscovyensis]|uniref:ATP-binding protein n=1 Tax=Nonomuraea muscovyensis TaxID=1124761 RepID=UPI0033CEDF19
MAGEGPVGGPPTASGVPARSGPAPAEPLLEQPFDGDSLYALRATLEAHASQAGFPDGRVMDLVMTVHELATNAVLHGAGRGTVRLWRVGGTLRCEVRDAGPSAADPRAGTGTDDGTGHSVGGGPRDGADPGSIDSAGEGTGGGAGDRWPVRHGHGLWIARYLTDGFTLATGPDGTVATVDFTVPAGPAGDSPFALGRHERGSYVLLELTGTLSEQAAEQVTTVVGDIVAGDRARPRLVLDLSGVTFWDAVGVAALITAKQRVEAASGALVLTGLTAGFRQRLDALSPTPFTVYDDRHQADHHFRTPPGS